MPMAASSAATASATVEAGSTCFFKAVGMYEGVFDLLLLLLPVDDVPETEAGEGGVAETGLAVELVEGLGE